MRCGVRIKALVTESAKRQARGIQNLRRVCTLYRYCARAPEVRSRGRRGHVGVLWPLRSCRGVWPPCVDLGVRERRVACGGASGCPPVSARVGHARRVPARRRSPRVGLSTLPRKVGKVGHKVFTGKATRTQRKKKREKRNHHQLPIDWSKEGGDGGGATGWHCAATCF